MLRGVPEVTIESTQAPECIAGPRLMPVFAGLGPVLMVRGSPDEFHAGWRVRQTIDSFGVREYLECGSWRLHRLPDSDFLGWERIARDAVLGDAIPGSRFSSRMQRLACTVRIHGIRIEPVARLSSIGWQVVQVLLRIECARLVDVTELR